MEWHKLRFTFTIYHLELGLLMVKLELLKVELLLDCLYQKKEVKEIAKKDQE